jgi:4a-hydroxytetrahydrobiopterin dehydratase
VVDSITSEQFHESPGVEDWRVLGGEASARFRTGSFARGVAFIDVIGVLADSANHHPDVDLRYASVSIRLTTHEIHGLSERDASLAKEISALAREMNIQSEPVERE